MTDINSPLNEAIAKNACNYARTYIIKGNTHLINNTYDALRRNHIGKGIGAIRALFNENSKYSIEVNYVIAKFYNVIKVCKKFSLGNCTELSFMALDYVIKYTPAHISAEIFKLEGGDHAFLVIGRQEGSAPNLPQTWGEQAYICDPLLNQVYPASQYLTKLKGFFSLIEIGKNPVTFRNFLEDFDPHTHTLVPYKYFNAHYIRTAQSNEHVQKITNFFKTKAQLMLKAISTLQRELTQLADELKKYNECGAKRRVILNLIVNIQTAKKEIKDLFKVSEYESDYLTFRTKLESNLKNGLRLYAKSLQVSEKNKKTLCEDLKLNSIRKKILYFFKPPPNTTVSLNKALIENKNRIDEIFKP
ncbi:hypothetical protein ACNVED_08380 [Legionella sp. D16C41]|uniref:hypothetical protein n=1 Tax=Legionella sp. D16C41 TaxID=3402688 RepID=UPI003AF4B418